MPVPDHAVRDHLTRHHGVISTDQLRRLGVASSTLDRWKRSGLFTTVHHGVVRITTQPFDFEARCLAACLADPEIVVGAESAARFWGFKHTKIEDTPVVIAPHDRTPIVNGVLVRRTNLLQPSHIVHDRRGIRYTSPARTWFDRAWQMNDHFYEALTEQILDRWCSVPTLWAMGRLMRQRGRPGSARVRRVMSQRAEWQKPADSTLEYDVLKALAERGVDLVRQHSVTLRNGQRIHLDGADPIIRWGVEIDHVTWHGGRVLAQADTQRRRSARLVGWEIEQVTDQAWRDARRQTLDDLVELYVAHGGHLAA